MGGKIRFASILFTAVLAAFSLFCGPAAGQSMMEQVRKYFELSTGQTVDREGNVLLVISTGIDYRRLVFFRKPYGYEAEYRIYIEVRGEKGHKVRGDVVEKSVIVPRYEMTRGAGQISEATKRITVEPGDYKIKVIIEVVNTSLEYERTAKVSVTGRERGFFEIAGPAFSVPEGGRRRNRPPMGELVFSGCTGEIEQGFRSMPGEVFAGLEGWIRMSFTIISPTENRSRRDIEVALRVQDAQDRTMAYTRKSVVVDGEGRGSFCVDVNVDAFPLGSYRVDTAASIPNTTRKAVGTGKFTVLLSRAMFDEYYDDTLELLSYVVEDRDLEQLRAADPERRIEQWNKYWRSEDPTRTTILNESLSEFLGRVRFSLENFSVHVAGWKTDLGRIYIRHGPPDNEEDRDGRTLGSHLKIWYYYSEGIVFIFEDPSGTGLYRLLDTRSI